MIRSIVVRSCSAPVTAHSRDLRRSQSSTARFSDTIRCSSRSDAFIPKLEPFSRTKLERAIREPSLIEKTENELTDYCTTLEGDDSYSCWKAYFELKDLEQELPKKDVESVIRQAGGVKSLIGFVHGIASDISSRGKKNGSSAEKAPNTETEGNVFFHIPDGLPKSAEELEEEESARMPDSAFTRLLRAKGRYLGMGIGAGRPDPARDPHGPDQWRVDP